MRALVGRTAARQQQHRCCAQGIASGLGSGGASSSATTMMARALPSSSAMEMATDATAAPAADRAAPSLQQPSLPHYADYPIDRAAELRTDAKALAALFDAPQSRLLPVLAPTADSAARVLVVQQQQERPLAPAWVRPASAVSLCLADGGGLAGCMFLGLNADGAGVFAGRVRPDGADSGCSGCILLLITAMGRCPHRRPRHVSWRRGARGDGRGPCFLARLGPV